MRNNFLQALPQRDYPEEYFIARIRGKRQRLIRDWEGFVYSATPEGLLRMAGYGETFVWKVLLRRYHWLYSEMNSQLRDYFWSYFGWIEMRNLFIAMRFLRQGLRERIAPLLEKSLLSEELKMILFSEKGFGDMVRGITGYFSLFYERFLQGYELFLQRGMRELEAFMYERVLEYLVSLQRADLMRSFFSYLIDMRNIMNLYRSIKWHIPFRDFISGGTIDRRLFDKIKREDDLTGIIEAIKRLSRLYEENPEDALLKGLRLLLKKRSYEPDGRGLILYYLWSLYLECRNLSTILEAGGIEKTRLSEEVL